MKSEKLKSESLAELLTAIYNEKVEPEELKQVDRLNIKTNPLKKELKTHRKQLEAEYKELSFQFVSFKALYTQSRKRWNKLLTITKEKN